MRAATFILAALLATPAASAELRQEFPFPKAAVYEALIASIPEAGFKLKDQDAMISRVTASSGMSLTSYGETMSMSVVDIVPGASSAIEFGGNLKMSTNILATGKPRKNFDKIVFAVSRRLRAEEKPVGSK